MAIPALPILVLTALGLAAAGSSRRRGRIASTTARGRVCALPVASVSLEDADEQDRWVRCPGRSLASVQQLSDRLRVAGRAARADRVLALYDRRRAVEDAPPDASSVSTTTRTEVDRTLTADPSTIPVEPAPETVAPTGDAAPPPRASHGSSSTSTTPRTTRTRTTPTRAVVDYSDASRERPHAYNASRAASQAPELVACLRQRMSTDCRRRLRQFQTSAGIPVDGTYGTITYYALAFWLGNPTGDAAPPLPSSPLSSDRRKHYVAPGHDAPSYDGGASTTTTDQTGIDIGREMSRDLDHDVS